ncbi:DNA-binding FadR family transcriptional regulator [Nocardioides sp. BE266]|uniref:FadR/GntR family transcriptional regulator n=1 Tax=Nocardioides sp. BE266 TaxID=2817725 RepID=UPI00285FC574|nr:FCD domain-containing protein [Nocardioides sp. BE266]MDR7254137.1 DNA-binding FadR family transcriptional regulator [Nocardioides sp. BE266]
MSTAHSTVLAELGPRIVRGDLPVGTVITLEWLGEAYGVSRTVAREVVQVLVSMGLVESRRRTGVRILPREEWDDFDPAVIRWRLDGADRVAHLHQLAQLRAAVEPASAALAAVHADETQRSEIVRIAEEMEDSGAAGDLRAFLEQDIAFHRLLLRASGNVMFSRLGGVVEEVLRGRTDHDLMPPEPKREARRLHQVVADAVAGGEAEVARFAMTAICAEVVSDLGHAP